MKRSSSPPESQPASKRVSTLASLQLHPLLATGARTESSTGTTENAGSSISSLTQALTLHGKKKEKPAVENPFLAHWKEQEQRGKGQKFGQLGQRNPRIKNNNGNSSSDSGIGLDSIRPRIPHFDLNLKFKDPNSSRSMGRMKALKFHQPGDFIAEAEAERLAVRIRQLEKEISQEAEGTESLELFDEGLVADLVQRQQNHEGALEWWDTPFVRTDGSLAFELLGNLIQRPPLVLAANYSNSKPSTKASSSLELKIYLTAAERKKLRRQRRLEAQRELQEQIALGLLPPPPPRLKLSSLPRMLAQPGNALGDSSVSSPSALAAQIKADEAAREAAHVAANTARQLTPEERALKKFKKYAELEASELHRSVILLRDPLIIEESTVTGAESRKKLFKLQVNASQNHLQGRLVIGPSFSLIIVEGGPKGINRYERLVLQRMPSVSDRSSALWSQLLWHGVVGETGDRFLKEKEFRVIRVDGDFEANESLNQSNWSEYWKLAKTYESGQE